MAQDSEKARLDDAARAGWLYFVAGNTQDEIARKLNVSRPTAQRLVSLAISERLITFRLEHPIARCMEMAARLAERFGLVHCEVAPSDPATETVTIGIAELTAAFIEGRLKSDKPVILAIGTGRSLRAAVDQIQPMKCPHHELVSMVGNITPDGSASFFDVLSKLADLTQARHYPIPLPLMTSSAEEKSLLLGLGPVRRVHQLAEKADVTLVGIGHVGVDAPLFLDGFISREEVIESMRLGAVGEICSWCFDAEGRILEKGFNARITSVRHQVPPPGLKVGVAAGRVKVPAIRAAMAGRIINGLITNEETAELLLGS
ncbi:sugar-binding transcriptional regulator [Chthonobacter albigriseus]|uniref:sugar-binding transcriptional regulator n=1 Tax=Chthonobacter albigriseus TaxID=1683161 RepID=UPI0015EE41CD|nr:sugar-binding transcriptional regulator [Chthonobacter albigriseus]